MGGNSVNSPPPQKAAASLVFPGQLEFLHPMIMKKLRKGIKLRADDDEDFASQWIQSNLCLACNLLSAIFASISRSVRWGSLKQIEKMEVISSLVSLLIECGKPVCGPVCLNIKSCLKLRSNIQTLDKDLGILLHKKNDIKNEIGKDENDGRVKTSTISSWLTEVDEIIESTVIPVLPEDCCLNCSPWRYRQSKQVVEKLEKVGQLISSPRCEPPYTVNPMVKPVEQLNGAIIKDQKTAKDNLAKLLELLKDDGVRRIGMFGMGGIGKSTLIINLNNELESFNNELESMSVQPFTVVIWVVVSKDFQLEKVQDQIFERLKMTKIEGESARAKATRLFERLQKEKKFIVILDDVWEAVNLDEIGIPRPENRVGCKLILTTRLQEVCRDMMTKVFPLSVLNESESWDLFTENAGAEIVCDQGIRSLAEAVTKECGGLPLAIITMGRAMRGKSIDSWIRALKSLEKSNPAPHIPGIEKKLFLPLKLSYDSLAGHKNIKACFLYCCLYPEDFQIEIDELLQCWEAEGLMDEIEDHDASLYSSGHSLIEKLTDSCLLEVGYHQGTVRLHDVVRDVSIWIASSEDEHKSLIHQHFASSQIPGMQTWGSYKRVSFMYGKIEMLPESVSQYSQVTSLLLQGNTRLKEVPVTFIEGFFGLRVLNLSDTGIQFLPPEMQVIELHALFLKNCSLLRKFPSLRGLSRLRVLDLSGTCLEMSSYGIKEMLFDLSSLDNLLDFYVDILATENPPHIEMSSVHDFAWLRRLRRFRISIASMLTTDKDHVSHYEQAAYLCGVNSSSEALKVFWRNATALILFKCQNVIDMWKGVSDVGLSRLKSITVDHCSWTVSMRANYTHNDVLLPNLEVLSLRHVSELWSTSELVMRLGTNMRIIKIFRCDDLKQLFSFDVLHKLENLEEIYVNSCHNLMEIITDRTAPVHALPKLRIMELKDLPRLESICQQELPWSCLQRIEVKDCHLLKKLPFSSQVQMQCQLRGDYNWWKQLQWVNEDMKSNLQQHFQPM